MKLWKNFARHNPRLLYALIGTVWAIALTIVFFAVGIWIGTTYGSNAGLGYFSMGWLIYVVIGVVPYVLYTTWED